ncbi:DUF308 domain-containing protein [Streptococcus hyointestinalis]|nr:DUF308 domain-containing protein [Streptococcus hyointestinalis]
MKTNRALSFIAGIILAIIGIYLLFVPSLNLFSLSWLIAVAFLVGALAEIIYYFSDSGEFRSIWGLSAAIVSAIFGIYLLSGYFLTLPILMPTVIGFWLLILGIVRLFQSIGTSTSLPELSNNLLWTSIGMIILGIVLMFNPLLASIVVAYIVAIALIYQGFVLMIDAFKR